MTRMLDIVSPIDGTVYASGPVLSADAAADAVARARAAQPGWATMPLAERIAAVPRATEIIGRGKDRMASKIAHQMGRPVRHGGESGGFQERVRGHAGRRTCC